ncbi:hypothetical protein [Aurantiacibacter zhengii]|nr:hypothetical protein [Aurantiacibacter zhengii]
MIHVIRTASATAFLLISVGAHAQDGTGQPTPTPTSQPSGVERVEGVPDDFSLEPTPGTARRNRMEPMVQPLPTATATPRQRQDTPTLVVPQPTPVPQTTVPVQPQERETAARQQPAPLVSDEPQDAAPPPQFEAQDNAAVDIAPFPVETEAPSRPVVDQALAESDTVSSTGGAWIVWLLAGLALLAAAIVGFVWFRRRGGTGMMVVEKIEPYRPTPVPEPAAEPGPTPEPVSRPEEQPEPAPAQPSGLVQAKRPAAATSSGGFVTSSIAARPRGVANASEQAPRSYKSADGRIVTSLSSGRRPRS